MAESRDWAAVCIAPVIRRETSSPFQVVPVHKESPGRITASFELMQVSREKGVIVRCNDTGFAIAPPLVITEQEIDELVNALAETLEEVLGA